MSVKNSDIASIFYRVADLLEIEGANGFRVRAYRAAGHGQLPHLVTLQDLRGDLQSHTTSTAHGW